MSNTTLPIQPRLAEQAAKEYLAIEAAGLLDVLDIEIRESIQAHESLYPVGRVLFLQADKDAEFNHRLDRWRMGDGWYLREPNRASESLASMLDCPTSAVAPYVVPEMVAGPTRRTIVLDCLRNVANRARKEMAQQQRRRTA